MLFLDEANTSTAVSIIKELMCDGTLLGRDLPCASKFRMVAVVSPYRRLCAEAFQRVRKSASPRVVFQLGTTSPAHTDSFALKLFRGWMHKVSGTMLPGAPGDQRRIPETPGLPPRS